MTPFERAGYLAHARTAVFARQVAAAEAAIAAGLARCRRPYVAFSAGKDSSVMLWLVLRQRPDVEARLLTSGETRLLHRNLDDVLAWWRNRFPRLVLREVHVDRVFAPGWEQASWRAQRKAGEGDLALFLRQGEVDGVFLGLRSEESNRRAVALRRHREAGCPHALHRYADGLLRIAPLAAWRTADVGALTAERDLPLLEAYGAHGLATRTTARLTGTAARQGALDLLRQRDRESYNRLVRRFPELAEIGGIQ